MTALETPATADDDSIWSDLRSRTVEWRDPIRVAAAGAAQSGMDYR